MWSACRKHYYSAKATPTALTRYQFAKHHSVYENNTNGGASSLSSHAERGILHKNVYGNSIRLYAHLPVPQSYDRYSLDDDNDDHKQDLPQMKPCYINTNSVTFAMLRARADGISIGMLSEFLKDISEDLQELSLMNFEQDVKHMAIEGSDEILKLLQDPLVQSHLQNFALSIKKADLVEAWPLLCKYGHLVEDDREEAPEDDGFEPKKKMKADFVDFSAVSELDREEGDDDFELKKNKKQDLAGLRVIEEMLTGKISSSADAEDSISKDRNEEGALVVVSASKKNIYGPGSSVLHMISGKHLMLLLVFLMVIYRGLSTLFQQRRVKTLYSKPSLDSLIANKQ